MKKNQLKNLVPVFLLGIAVLTFSACTKLSNSPVPAPSLVVTTFSGSTTQGSANGTGAAASFYRPSGVAIDIQGNIYVADAGNNLIRKITPASVVTTVAGSGAEGADNGTGTAASFKGPQGLAIDAAGNLYVADVLNQLIRKITPGGVVTTLAGGGTTGTNGTGTAAGFGAPTGVAVDATGNVFVADAYLVRKITPAGVVTTVAGTGVAGSANGTGTAASFNLIIGITVDRNNNLYVTDSGNNLIRKITSDGVVTTVAGSGVQGSDDGIGTAASFNKPIAITVDAAGSLYISDISHLIRAIDASGKVVTLAGTGLPGAVDGGKATASFSIPYGLAVIGGNLFIGDTFNNDIRRLYYQ